MAEGPTLSICIVSFNARAYLRQCLGSIWNNQPPFPFEVIVVDNDSHDGSAELCASDPRVKLIRNEENRGFAAANNQALHAAAGKYLLWLNSDTIVLPAALERLVNYLENHPEAGIVGPKVLNADRSMQMQCRRGAPTVWASFCYFAGLSRLRPRDPRFTGYLLTHLNPDEVTEVTSVSGSCLGARRDVLETVGPLDPSLFMYGEDLDWCFRARAAGWKVIYFPGAEIVHFGGQGGTQSRRFRATLEFHRSMWRVFRKHFAHRHSIITQAAVLLAIISRCGVTLLLNCFRRRAASGSLKANPEL